MNCKLVEGSEAALGVNHSVRDYYMYAYLVTGIKFDPEKKSFTAPKYSPTLKHLIS